MKSGKGALLLLADEDKEEKSEDSEPDMLKTAVKTLFAAMKAGDVDAGAKALKSAVGACQYSEDEKE